MDFNLIEHASEALNSVEAAGIPVQQGWYDEDIKQTHVTLWELDDSDIHSNDAPELTTYLLQVTIFSQKDETALKKRIKRLMREAGYTFMASAGSVDTRLKVHMKAMRFHITVEAIEEE